MGVLAILCAVVSFIDEREWAVSADADTAISMRGLIAYISHGVAGSRGSRTADANRVDTTIDLAHVARLHYD